MYTDIILDYYRNPRNFGTLEGADIRASDSNPLCGDEIEMSIRLDGGRVADARWSGKGCAISQAAVSMLVEMIIGRDLKGLRETSKDELLGKLGVPLSPARLKCALLGLKVLKLGVYGHLSGQQGTEDGMTGLQADPVRQKL